MGLRTTIYTVVFVTALAMIVTLLVFWNIYIIKDYHTIKELYAVSHGSGKVPVGGRWTVLILGITFFCALLVVFSVFFVHVLRGARFKKQQRDFVNMMTHELKLPMSSIQMFAQTLLQKEAGAEERTRFLECILNDCARMNMLVDHLLRSQQIERGGLSVHRRAVELKDFLERFAARWPRPLRTRLGESVTIQADPVLLELALVNLVSNAEKYGKGSVPELILESDERAARIAVEDGGGAIPRKYAKKIFRKFFRVPNLATRRQNGVGLGLYIVRSVARQHKGEIALSPAIGDGKEPRGNRFTLSLPRRG